MTALKRGDAVEHRANGYRGIVLETYEDEGAVSVVVTYDPNRCGADKSVPPGAHRVYGPALWWTAVTP